MSDRRVLLFDGHVPAGRSATIKSENSRLELIFPLTAGEKNSWYALLIPADAAPKVVLNNRSVDLEAVRRSDGLLYQIPGPWLNAGTNSIVIERAPGDSFSGWDRASLFSLVDTVEEVHFVQAFSDAAPDSAVTRRSVGPRAQPAADSLQALYDVQYYDCSWTPSLSAASLTAASVIVGAKTLGSSLSTFVLDFHPNSGSMVVDSVDSGPATAALTYTIDSTNRRIRVTLPSTVPANTLFQVRVNYHGTPASRSLFGNPYVRNTHSGTSIIYTFSEPYGARYWFPCKDLPDDKATTTIQRITVPTGAGWQVISNGLLRAPGSGYQSGISGALQGSVNNGNGTETWIWENNFPISTYLLSLCVTNYTYSSALYTGQGGTASLPIRHAIFPENVGSEGSAAIGTLQVMNFLAQTFGEYPFLSAKYYTASHLISSGMEHQTNTSVPGGTLLDGTQRQNVHELAHHWFGDLITCRSMDHLWLNEGFATYAEALWFAHQQGPQRLYTYVANWTPTSSTPVVSSSADNFSNSVVYVKGSWVLHMLRHVLGDAAFFQTLQTYVATPSLRYSTALSSDFQAVAENVSGKNLTSFFNQWLYRPGNAAPGTGGLNEPSAQPTYRYTASSHKTGSDYFVDLVIDQTQSGTPFVMPIDVMITDIAGTRQVQVVQNSTASQSYSLNVGPVQPQQVYLDPDNWILATDGLALATCGLPRATTGQAYKAALRGRFGSAPYTWSTTGGLPAGLTLASTGVVTGTATVPGTYSVGVQLQDNAGAIRNGTALLEVGNFGSSNAIVVESRVSVDNGGGKTAAPAYQEIGTFSNTDSKSGAPGCVGAGSRYNSTVGTSVVFAPAIASSGGYNVYVTLDYMKNSRYNNARANWVVTGSGAPVNGSVYINPFTPGLAGQWLLLASNVQFNAGAAGSAGTVGFSNVDGDGSGNFASRFAIDAVKLEPVNSAVDRWELQ